MPNIKTLSDDLFAEVAKKCTGYESSAYFLLAEMLGVSHKEILNRDYLLLYGRRKGRGISERLIGRLRPIITGVVILEPFRDTVDWQLVGLLERFCPANPALFYLRPFRPAVGLTILPSENFRNGKTFPEYPAVITYNIGAGHGEEYDDLGIDSGRWEFLQSWLDKWLPSN